MSFSACIDLLGGIGSFTSESIDQCRPKLFYRKGQALRGLRRWDEVGFNWTTWVPWVGLRVGGKKALDGYIESALESLEPSLNHQVSCHLIQKLTLYTLKIN